MKCKSSQVWVQDFQIYMNEQVTYYVLIRPLKEK